MANTYLPAQQYVNIVVAELFKRQNLSGLITPFSMENMVGTLNDTVIYRTKGITKARDYQWRRRTEPIIFDEVYRNQIPITLGNHMTVGNKWTDEERKFDITSIETEIAQPMADAMVERFDLKILQAIKNADWAVTDLNVTAPADANERDNSALKSALALKAKLDAAGTPKDGRVLVLGANAFTYFAASKATLVYDQSQARTVYQKGTYGQIADFDIFNGTGIIGDNEIIAVHKSWAVLANAAPELVPGMWNARRTFAGHSARLLAGYDMDSAVQKLLLNTFWGISEIKDQYARHTQATADAANDGSEAGDIIITDGKTQFTGKNVRGGKGTFTQL